MFVERLSNEKLRNYFIMYKNCDNDVKVEFLEGTLFLYRVENYVEREGGQKKTELISITDFKFNYVIDPTWIKYLYSIFGKDFMDYYDEVALKFRNKIFAE